MGKIEIMPFTGSVDKDLVINLQGIGLTACEADSLAELIINNSGHGSYIKTPDSVSKQSLVNVLVRSGFEVR